MTTAYTEEDVLIRIENVCKEYDGKPVLKNVSATIKDIRVEGQVTGQIVGFVGPSGIGKSTLFRIMAGLEQPTSGRVVLDGLNRPVAAGEVGVVAQNYPLFAHRTVWGNLILAAKKASGTVYECGTKVSAYMQDFDLADCVNKYPSQLSGGQRQRCAIIQQVLQGGRFLLMDEPFSGLDPIAKKKTSKLITKIANLDERNTIIIVTHDIGAAVAVSDHLWLLGRNRGSDGRPIPGAFIVETVNLIERDLAWHPGIQATPQFAEAVIEIEKKFEVL